MKILGSILVIATFLFLIGCRVEEHELQTEKQRLAIEYKAITIILNQMVTCKYPQSDPIFEKKKNWELLLFDMSVGYTQELSAPEKEYIIPTGAILTDTRGNEYVVSTQAIAMAQSSHCVKGDDIDSYNAIWSASLKKGETKRGFVLGFELPEGARPARLYWNPKWEQQNFFFNLIDSSSVLN